MWRLGKCRMMRSQDSAAGDWSVVVNANMGQVEAMYGNQREEAAKMLRNRIETMPLVDNHVHSCLSQSPDELGFERLLCESAGPLGNGQSRVDSQAGFALARYCSPLLFGQRCDARDYFLERRKLKERQIGETLLPAAGVSTWIIDPGWAATNLISVQEFALRAQGEVHTVVRLEAVAESVLATGLSAGSFPEAFRSALSQAQQGSVGFKTICAYRCGFDIDWRPPSDDEVIRSVSRLSPASRSRIDDAIVCSFMVHEAMRYRKPIQFHVGLGDRDVDLRHSNPVDLRPLLVESEQLDVPMVLLHCWPFERECGYLCQNFTNVYMDVGLAMYLCGVQGVDALRRSMELCPFSRLLYSSDAWGLPEQHYFAAKLFRDSLASLVCGWVEQGAWTAEDALRVVDAIGSKNAQRLYGVGSCTHCGS